MANDTVRTISTPPGRPALAVIAANAAVEAIATIMTIRQGILHPTINYEHPDPECDLDCVPNEARRAEVDVALSNSFGFGGQNACLVFRSWET